MSSFLNGPLPEMYFFFKGRTALYHLLKASGIGDNDEVLIQGFTCVAVPNAIFQAGAKPIYCDIQSAQLNMELGQAQAKMTPRTKAIVVQNTFGLSSYVDSFRKFCDEKNLLLIEDCTHGFGGAFEGRSNGTIAHAAFFSTQWSKPFASGLGGFAFISSPDKFPHKEFLQGLPRPPVTKDISLWLQNIAYSLLVFPLTLSLLRKLYQLLYRHGIVTGSSTTADFEPPQKGPREAWTMGSAQLFFSLLRISRLRKNLSERQNIGKQINNRLRDLKKWHYAEAAVPNHSFLRYPVFSQHRDEVVNYIEHKYRVFCGDWFTSPIYPIDKNWENWDYTPCPQAESFAKKIFNLPTDHKIVCEKILNDPYVIERIE
ncbi:MAG TPA: DegT/DnrJ/EryC1/StrS family aminotransferase [Bdellovibrio sp.]|nr:DegT/DnrJ/EryC1/StrS family aminotransferase [Bdellovibrio sp.]